MTLVPLRLVALILGVLLLAVSQWLCLRAGRLSWALLQQPRMLLRMSPLRMRKRGQPSEALQPPWRLRCGLSAWPWKASSRAWPAIPRPTRTRLPRTPPRLCSLPRPRLPPLPPPATPSPSLACPQRSWHSAPLILLLLLLLIPFLRMVILLLPPRRAVSRLLVGKPGPLADDSGATGSCGPRDGQGPNERLPTSYMGGSMGASLGGAAWGIALRAPLDPTLSPPAHASCRP